MVRRIFALTLLLSSLGCANTIARMGELADTAGISTSVTVRDGGQLNASVAGNGFAVSVDPLSLACGVARLIPIDSPIDSACRMMVVEEKLR